MFKEIIQPRFNETDALGHINNTVLTQWFEGARDPIFKLFTPDLNTKQWRLILASISVQFKAELFYGLPVELRTGVSMVGNSSFEIHQEAWQQGRCCALGKAVLVQYDFDAKQKLLLSHEQKVSLNAHLISAS
ncbi:acyl-CoA thioesterase [Rheinheimera tangshanensis]|mgnify:CR=1 FL=1|jgi:acyl-CoA thioester hydrolase|uniref:Acyl-CoA thioesterase n=1 Tax=Rheinheimera tangshanensis TaxID=400153 RepID=A0A5C8M2Z4_9GAMM|nr:thioesterase family protein [Rheinheimera tangshanensis]TXK82288.1 acyl-CoA thioesterase [Rheinheimera tangshanensis]GGM53613.1 thioesterase [Rheinheimera tangshanensis]